MLGVLDIKEMIESEDSYMYTLLPKYRCRILAKSWSRIFLTKSRIT